MKRGQENLWGVCHENLDFRGHTQGDACLKVDGTEDACMMFYDLIRMSHAYADC